MMFASTRICALAGDVTQRAESHTLPPVSVIIGPTEQCRSYIVSVWAQSKVIARVPTSLVVVSGACGR
jgi:hypothetical protein